MVNLQKQIDYWIAGAEDDILTAELLIRENRSLQGLFFCHLVIEKALKAHFVKHNRDVAPRTHNLMYLSDMSGLTVDENMQIFMGILMKYQLQGRYPDFSPVLPRQAKVEEYLQTTKELLQWLKMML